MQMLNGRRAGGAFLALVLGAGAALAQSSWGPAMDNPSVRQPDAAPMVGANSFTQGQAQAVLERNGYSEISPLMNEQGVWHGTAKKGGARMSVGVDYKGHITARQD
jgi:hypothetical protein